MLPTPGDHVSLNAVRVVWDDVGYGVDRHTRGFEALLKMMRFAKEEEEARDRARRRDEEDLQRKKRAVDVSPDL